MRRARIDIPRGLTAVLLMATTVAAAWGAAQPGREAVRAQPSEDAALVRELAERLLAPPSFGPAGDAPRVRLLAGALPAELPLPLPLPAGGRLIGSAVHSGQGGRTDGTVESIEVLLDAPGTPTAVLAFYERALADLGWSPPGGGTRRPGGFQPALQPLSAAFCQSERGPWLNLNVFPRPGGPSDVRVRVELGVPKPCFGPGGPPAPEPPSAAMRLPGLSSPAGVQILAAGFFPARPGLFASDATAETALGVEALEAYFAEQLTAAGWQRLEGAAQGPLAWSTWAVPGEGDFQGFLYVLAGPGENRRSLHLRVESGQAVPQAVAVPLGR